MRPCSGPPLSAPAGQNQRVVSSRRERYEWTPAMGLWNPASPQDLPPMAPASPDDQASPPYGRPVGAAVMFAPAAAAPTLLLLSTEFLKASLAVSPSQVRQQDSSGSYTASPLGRASGGSGAVSSQASPARQGWRAGAAPVPPLQLGLLQPGGSVPQTPYEAGITGEPDPEAAAAMWHGIALPDGLEEGHGESGGGGGGGGCALHERPESVARRALDPLLDWADGDQVLHETPNGLGPLAAGAATAGAAGAAGAGGGMGVGGPPAGAAAGENAVPGGLLDFMGAAVSGFFGMGGAGTGPAGAASAGEGLRPAGPSGAGPGRSGSGKVST